MNDSHKASLPAPRRGEGLYRVFSTTFGVPIAGFIGLYSGLILVRILGVY